jgi:acyl-coenzyme A synthetase/AMP-(fatty) acid ligase
LQQPVLLDDVFDIQSDGQFKVIGRATDLIKIGGKRASISELNQRLQAISGITDGCFYRMEHSDVDHRLGIIVVSEHQSETIISELRQHLDEVFLPRVVYYTKIIPRNSVGKLLNSELIKLISQLKEPL